MKKTRCSRSRRCLEGIGKAAGNRRFSMVGVVLLGMAVCLFSPSALFAAPENINVTSSDWTGKTLANGAAYEGGTITVSGDRSTGVNASGNNDIYVANTVDVKGQGAVGLKVVSADRLYIGHYNNQVNINAADGGTILDVSGGGAKAEFRTVIMNVSNGATGVKASGNETSVDYNGLNSISSSRISYIGGNDSVAFDVSDSAYVQVNSGTFYIQDGATGAIADGATFRNSSANNSVEAGWNVSGEDSLGVKAINRGEAVFDYPSRVSASSGATFMEIDETSVGYIGSRQFYVSGGSTGVVLNGGTLGQKSPESVLAGTLYVLGAADETAPSVGVQMNGGTADLNQIIVKTADGAAIANTGVKMIDGELKLTTLEVATGGTGVDASGGASVKLGTVTVSTKAVGLIASGSGTTATISEDLIVDASTGAVAELGGTITVQGDVRSPAAASGSEVFGVYASRDGTVAVKGDIVFDTANARGATADGGRALLSGDVMISGDNGYGLLARGGGTVEAGGSAAASALYVSGDSAWHMLTDGGAINLTNVAAGSADSLNLLKTDNSGNLNAKDSVLTGDITHTGAAAGTLAVALSDGSALTGTVNTMDASNGKIDMALTENSVWNITNDSSTGGLLDLQSGGTVDFTGASMQTQMSVASLTGSGTFAMKVDVEAGVGDKLVVGNAKGTHVLNITNSGTDSVDGTETLVVVDTEAGDARFSLANEVAIGAYTYVLRSIAGDTADGTDWELYAAGSGPAASGAVNTFAGSYLLAYAETQTLMQRLGDLRDTPYLSGFWFRVYGGKFESNSSSFVRGFDMDYGGVQVGYDRKIENNWKGDTYVGGYFGYSKGDLDYSTEHGNTGGNGKVDSKSVGAYVTYVQEDGFYADALVKYMWMKNDFDVLDTDGDRVTGDDLSTGGLGISLELGKRFRMVQSDKGGNWYIEPQVQYSYTHQDGGHYYASNGLRIGVDEFTSSIGRLGVLIGYETAKTNFYAKASFVKEFDGDVNIVANDVDIPESFGDSWWVYGLGFTSRLNDRNSIYLSLERSDGGKFDEPWKVYAGWRISF